MGIENKFQFQKRFLLYFSVKIPRTAASTHQIAHKILFGLKRGLCKCFAAYFR